MNSKSLVRYSYPELKTEEVSELQSNNAKKEGDLGPGGSGREGTVWEGSDVCIYSCACQF